MRVTVIQNYTDKYAGISYNVGAKVEYADDRAKALAEKGFVELTEKAIKADKVEVKVAKPKKTTKKK